ASVGCFEDELDDFAGVEVTANKFRIGFVFFKGHDREVGGGHDGFADGSDAGQEVLGEGGGGAREGLDEDDAVIGVCLVGVEALDTDGHSKNCGRYS
ncbi:MAG: hypothetical protein Q9180_008562, partial [Flavoplaca navasiana]